MEYTIKQGDTIYNLSRQFHVPIPLIVSANPGINPYNILVGQKVRIPVELIDYTAGSQQIGDYPGVSPGELNLRNALRHLWEQHVAWTRMAILSAASDSPDLELVVARLLGNASDMGAALRPIYGEEKAAAFERLIHDHLSIALQMVKAAKEGNTQAADQAEKAWYANADQIAAFLNAINPYINKEEFREMLHTHLYLTKEEAVARLNKDYAKDIALYDQIEDQALTMADSMAEGIVKQFPALFR